MVLIDHNQAVQTTRQTTTSSTNADIPSVSIADTFFNTGEKYLILASGQFDTASSSDDSGVTTLHGSTEFDGADQFTRHQTGSNPKKVDYFYWTVWTAVASEGVKMQFRTGGAGTTGADQVVLTAISLDDLTENTDWHFDENLTNTTLTTSFSTTNNAVVTFTPDNAGDDWLVLSTARCQPSGGTTNQIISRFSRSGEASFSVSDISQEQEISDADFNLQSNMHVFNLGASSNTFTQESRVDETNQSDFRDTSAIFAINLAKFGVDSSSATTTGVATLSTTDFADEIESVSITPTSTVDVFSMGYFVSDTGITSGNEARLQVDNTDSPATQTSDAYERNDGYDAKDQHDFFHQTIINLDNTLHTVDMDASATVSGPGVLNSSLVAFTLETAEPPASTKTFTVDAILEIRAETFLIDALIQALGDDGVCGGSGSTVQSGTAQIATADATEDVAITAVDLSKSFVVFNYRVDSTDPSRFLVKATLTSTTNIRFERDNTSGTNTPVDITWYVVESDDLTVQRGNNSMTSAVSNQTITAVDLSKAFRLTSIMNNGTLWDEDDLLKSRLTTTTNLELETDATVNLTDAVHWQVAEFEGASVQRGVATVDETELSTDVTISSVDLTKSFVLIDSSLSGAPANPANGCLRATLTSATNLHIERESFDATDTHTIAWEVVELPTEVTVQSGTESFTTSETQNNVTITAVGLSNTFVILSSRQREGQSSDSSGSNPHTAWFSAELTSSTNLQLTRSGSDSSTADVEWYVIELATEGKQRSCPEVDAILVITPKQKTFTVDAILTGIKNFTVDAMLIAINSKTFTIDARLQSEDELTYKFVEVTTDQSHTGDTNWTDISGAVIPSEFFVTGRKYLLVLTTQTVGTNINTNYGVRTQHGSTVFDGSSHVYEPNAVVTRTQYSYFNVWTAVEGEDIQMQFQTMTAGQTVNADQTTLFALEISEDFIEGIDWHSDAIVASTTLATTPSTLNNATITFTPPVASNDWLVISTGDIDTDANNVIYTSRTARSGEATSTTPSTTAEGEDSPLDDYVQTVFRVFTLGNASNTFEQEAFKSASPGPNSTREYSSIFAINLNRFLNHSFAYTDGTIAIDTTDDLSTSTQVQTDTLTPTVAGDTWIMGSFVTGGNAFQEIRARMQVDNVDQPPTQTSDNYKQLLGYDPDDESNWAIQTVEDLDTSSHTTDIDVTAETGTPSDRTAQFRNIFEVRLQIGAVQVNDETFTVDAFVRARFDKDFTVDAFIRALNQEETFAVDALIEQAQTKDFTVDAILLATQDETFTVDAFIQALDTEKTFTVDAVLQATFTFDFTVDAFIQALNQEETFDVDALIQAENQKMFLVDGLAQATQTETFDIDSIVVDRFTEDFTVDAKVIVRRTTTFDIDGLPQEQNIDKVFTIDAFIQEQNIDETFTIDGFPQATFTEDFEVDAFPQAETDFNFTVDGLVQKLDNDKTFTIDGLIEETFTKDFDVDGFPQATIDEDFLIDGFPQATFTFDFTVDSFIQKLDNDKTFLVDARIALRPEKTFEIDGLTQGANTKTFDVDALIQAEAEKMFLVDSVLTDKFTEGFLIDGLTRGTQTETFSIDARIVQLNTETFDIDALIEDTFDEDFTVNALIEDTADKDFTIDSILLATQTETFLIDAQIKQPNVETFIVDSLISKEQTTTFTVDAFIQKAFDKEFTIDSKLSRTKVFKIDAQIVRVERFDIDSILIATFDEDFLVDGILVVAGQKPFLVDAFLVTVNSEDFTVDSVLAEVKTVDYDVDAIIQEQDNEKTFVVDGLLPTTNQETFSVDSMPRARIDEDFEIDALVLKEQTETFEIDAHVENVFTKDFVIDGIVKAFNKTETFTVDTFSQLAKTINFTVDARVELESGKTFTVNAIVQQTQTKDFVVDGQLFAILTFTKDFDVDSLLKTTQTKTFSIDGVPVDPSSKIFAVNALLQALANTEVFTVDAKVVVVNTEDFTVDAQIIPIATNTKDFTVDAFIQILGQTFNFSVDTFTEELMQTSFTVGAVLLRELTINFTVDAGVTGGITKTFTVDAQIFLPTLANFTVDGFLIQPISLLEFTVDAKVQSPFTEEFTIDSILTGAGQKVFLVDGLTLGTQTKDFIIDAKVIVRRTRAFNVDAVLKILGDNASCQAVQNIVNALGEQDQTFNPGIAGSTQKGEGMGIRFTPKINFKLKDIEWNSTKGTGVIGRYKCTVYLGSTVPTSGNFNPSFSTVVDVADVYSGFSPNPEASFVQFWNTASQFRRTTFDAKGTNDGLLLQAGVQYFIVWQEVDINSGWTLSTTAIPNGNSSTDGSNPLTDKFITVEGTEHWDKVTSSILEAIQLTDEEFAFNMGVNAPTAGASCLQIDSILEQPESLLNFTVDAKIVRLGLFTVDALIKSLGDVRCSNETIIFSDDFTTNAGWTVIGTQIEIDVADSNKMFINCMRSNQFLNNQAVKTLPIPVNKDDTQLADIIFEFDHFHFKPCGMNFTMPAPFASNADWALTETNLQSQLNPAQAMLSYEFIPVPPASNQDPQGMRATYADGITEVSTSLISLVDNTQYFPRVTKQLNGILKLEIFTDSGRTTHASGSPVQVDASAVSDKQLNFIQLSNAVSGGQARRLKANIDNVIVSQSLCPQVTVDALIGIPDKSFLVDAILSTQGKFTVDAFLIIINDKTFEIDARVKALDTEKTFAVDAEITRGKIFLVNSILKLIADKSFTVDSRLSGIEEFNVDSKLVDRFEEDFAVDGSTLGTVEKDFTIDGILIVFPSGLILIDAIIQAQNNDKTFTIDSVIKSLETTKNFTIDSQLVQDEIPKQFTIDGRIIVIQTTTFDIDGVIFLSGENGICNFFPPTNILVDTGVEQFVGPIQPIHESGVEQLIGQEVTLNNQQVRSVTFLLRSSNFPNEITTPMPIDAQVWSDVVVGNFGGETTEAVSTTVINASNTSGDLPAGDWTLIKFEFDINTTPFLTGDFVVGYRSLSSVNDPAGVGTARPVISNSNVIAGRAVHRKGANSTLGDEDEWGLLTGLSEDIVIQLEVLNGDDIVLGEGNQCPLVDAVLVNIPNEFLVDSILINRFESEFSVDTVLFPLPKPFSIDGILVGTQVQFTIDAQIVPQLATFLIDVLITDAGQKPFLIDASIFGEDTEEQFLVDSFIQAISKPSPKFNLNAFLFVRRTKEFTVDGSAKFFNKVAPFTIDAQVIFFPSQLPQVDGLLQKLTPKFFFADAYVQRLNNLLFPFTDVDALIVKENVGKTFLVEGLIAQRDEKEFTIDAKLGIPQDPFLFTVDAMLLLENHRWRVDALVQKSINKLFLIEAFVVGIQQKPFLISGLTKGFDIDKNFTVDSLIQEQDNDETFTVDGRLQNMPLANFTIDAMIKGIGLTFDFTVDASLVRAKEFSINGAIQALGDGSVFTGNNGSTNANNTTNPFESQTTDDNTITLPIGTLVGQRLRLSTAPVRVTDYTFIIHRAGTAGTPTGTLTGKIYKNSIAGNTIVVGDLIATSDNVVNLSSITTNTNGQNVTFTFTDPPEITVDDNVFIGFDIAGSNEQMFLHTESTGTVIDGGDVNVESSGNWGVDLGVDAVLTLNIDIIQRQRASALLSSFVGRFSPQFEVNALVKAFDVEFEFTVSANIRFKRIEEFFVDAILIGSQDFTVSAFVGDTLFVGIEAESVIVENNSTNGIESVIVENNSDSGVESVIGQDT